MSLLESVANVVVGYAIAVGVQVIVFPLVGIAVTFATNLAIGVVFTVASVIRSYVLRRLFERFRLTGLRNETAALKGAAAWIGLWAGQLPMR